MIRKTTLKILLFVFFSALLASCSDSDKKGTNIQSNKAAITKATASERAEKRWNALINKDWKTAYSFETPAYRKTYTVEDYRGSFGSAVTWKSVNIISTEKTEKNITDVTLELTVFFTGQGSAKGMNIPSMFTERWLYNEDNWWHVISK
jgi:predicted small secreted protein